MRCILSERTGYFDMFDTIVMYVIYFYKDFLLHGLYDLRSFEVELIYRI